MRNIQDLVGKKFRRNAYGLSLWTDEIVSVNFESHWIKQPILKGIKFEQAMENMREANKFGYKPVAFVKGKNSSHSYYLDEIIIYL